MRMFLKFFNNMLPAAFVCLVIMNPITFAFPDQHIFSYFKSSLFVIAFTVIWSSCIPSGRYCRRGSLSETAFKAFPIELTSMLVFAQYHPRIAASITGGLAALDIIMGARVISMIFDIEDEDISESKTDRYEKRLRRHYFKNCVILAGLFFLVPTIISVCVYRYQSPVYKPTPDMPQDIRQSSTISGSTAENLVEEDQTEPSFFCCLKEDSWDALSPDKKITVLQNLVDYEAQSLGIPSVSISSGMIDAGTLGLYYYESGEIVIDLEVMSEMQSQTCIDTVCHEVYHHYQHYLVDHLDWESDVAKSRYFDEVKSWKENEADYKDAFTSDYDEYASQPVESSAREYAEKETARLWALINASDDAPD